MLNGKSKPRRRGIKRREERAIIPDRVRIPGFIPDFVSTGVYRYLVAPGYGSQTLSFTIEMPTPPFGVAHSADSFILPFKSIRISKLELWCDYMTGQDITGNTASVTFVDRRQVRPIEYSCVASNNCTGHIKKKFSPFDPLGLWYTTTSGESNPEINFLLTKGTVLQITYNWILSDGANCPSASGSSLTYPRVYSNRLNSNVDVMGKVNSAVIAM